MTNNNLSDLQKHVLKDKRTEPPFSGILNYNNKDGKYVCANCGEALFSSDEKFDYGSGWPSFYDVIDKSKVKLSRDASFGMIRTEVACQNCGGHLGHVFEGSYINPSGAAYCINSASLNFEPEDGSDMIKGDQRAS